MIAAHLLLTTNLEAAVGVRPDSAALRPRSALRDPPRTQL